MIGNDALYNDGGSNSITDRAVIADPEGTEINQALHQRCHHGDGGTPGSHSSWRSLAPIYRQREVALESPDIRWCAIAEYQR